MVIELQPDLITLGILAVEDLQKVNEIRALVDLSDKRNRFPSHQIKAGKQRQRTMADILIISVCGAIPFTGRKIRRSCGNRLNSRLLIVRNRMGFRFFSFIRDEFSIIIEAHGNLLVNNQNVMHWSELGKEGRLLILFVSQIIGCYMANIRKTMLSKEFHSLQ